MVTKELHSIFQSFDDCNMMLGKGLVMLGTVLTVSRALVDPLEKQRSKKKQRAGIQDKTMQVTCTSSTSHMNQQHITYEPAARYLTTTQFICTTTLHMHQQHNTSPPPTLGLIEYECGLFNHFSTWK